MQLDISLTCIIQIILIYVYIRIYPYIIKFLFLTGHLCVPITYSLLKKVYLLTFLLNILTFRMW
jgi:hypothetical protein